MVKIAIKNFQSIVKSIIELDGITCLVATNNTGKTAHCRALKALITNSSNKGQIRIGSSGFQVGILTEKHKIIYKRSKTVSYEVNKIPILKIGRDSLDKVFEGTGLLYDKESEDKVLPQFIFQGAVPFPFNLSPSKVYSQFAQFFGVEKLEDVMKSISADIREEKQNLVFKNGQIDQLTLSIGRQIDLLKIYPSESQVKELADLYRKAEEAYENAMEVKKLIIDGIVIKEKIDKTIKQILFLEAKVKKLIPLLEEITVKYDEVLKLEAMNIILVDVGVKIEKCAVCLAKLYEFNPVDVSQFCEVSLKIWGFNQDIDFVNVSIKNVNEKILEKSEEHRIVEKELNEYDHCPACGAPTQLGRYCEKH